jgi:hypothetical protein
MSFDSSLITKWHNKAKEQDDFFSQYVFEYLSFIAHIKSNSGLDTPSDRNCIQELKGNETIKQQYLSLMQKDKELKDAWMKIKGEFDKIHLGNASNNLNEVGECKWWNCHQPQLGQATVEEKQNIKGAINSLDNWSNMIEFWYIIRNNLFHGAKSPENERDLFVMEYGYKTLSKLMNLFLEDVE